VSDVVNEGQMIRFRLGQAWRNEAGARAQDSFSLDVDGVDLLSKATEESLVTVVPDLVEALSALYVDGEPLAQLSLPEAHLEIAMHRRDSDVDIAVADLGRPAHLARGPIKLDLCELASAAVHCALALMRNLRDCAPSLRQSISVQRMMRQVELLKHRPMASLRPGASLDGFRTDSGPAYPKSFQFELTDAEGLVRALGSAGRGALTSLLFGGSVAFCVESKSPEWRSDGRPFLLALEISRQAGEISHAVDLRERELRLQIGGVGPDWMLNLRENRAVIGAVECALSGSELARAMFNLGLELAYSISAQNRNQRRNPYIAAIVERCREGLVQLRSPIEPSRDGVARSRAHHPALQRALNRSGRLRRIRFIELWEKNRLAGDEPGRILLGARGPVVASGAMASGFSAQGDILFRRIAAHGVAASRDYWALTAVADCILCFVGGEKTARWLRGHDGLSIGPELQRKDGLLIVASASGAVIALSELTGREMWRIAPVRARQVFFSLQGHRALVAADSGHLYGLDLHDGQVRYRLSAQRPFAGPPLPWGRKMIATVGRRERFSLIAADAHRGSIHWQCELDLDSMAAPLPQGNRVFLAGERAGVGTLLCIGAKGQMIWERRLHLGRGPFTLLAPGGQRVIVCSPRGAAVSFSIDGHIEWRLGALESELLRSCPPAFARGVAVIPGETVRAVDVHSGEVLAELRAGIGLCDLKVDSKVNLYLLDEDGTLRALRLASHFAIVS
jgi:hypothetical protein